MKEKNLFELHKEWSETGRLPNMGLCFSLPERYQQSLDLFEPSEEYRMALLAKGLAFGYWGYEGKISDDDELRHQSYTTFRQTITLFICAIHNEIP